MNKPGTLYLCATPIGNLEDMTYRAVRVLGEVAAIAAEDTRHTRKLLSHYAVHTPLVSYHEQNKARRGPELVSRLLAGEDLAVVSDAGLPGIADPGADLVKLALEAGITVSPLPGPTAALSAAVCSGLDTRMFLFAGFLPKTTKKRRERVGELAGLPYTLVLYESPHRLVATLDELLAAFGDRPAVAWSGTDQKIRGILSLLPANLMRPLQEHCSPRRVYPDRGREHGRPRYPRSLWLFMKSTGIVRKVDELGRVVIPIELRRTLDIEEKDALEIYVDSDRIILRKYEPACVFCGNADEVTNFKGKNVCKECLTSMGQRAV